MKKKKCLLLISLFIVQLFFSQQTYDALVQYDVAVKFRGFKVTEKNQFLLMNKKESVYFEYKNPKVDYEAIYADFNNKKQVFRLHHKMNSNEYMYYTGISLFKDVAPEIKWQIKTDKKEILGFTCQKAVGKFRGREYTVWFTMDIPYNYGPWKLRGLPGVILEAGDKKKQNTFYATKVSLNKNYKLPSEIIKRLSESKKVLPYRRYTVIMDSITKMVQKQALASLPKGVDAKIDGYNFRGSNLEVTYEWEDEYEK